MPVLKKFHFLLLVWGLALGAPLGFSCTRPIAQHAKSVARAASGAAQIDAIFGKKLAHVFLGNKDLTEIQDFFRGVHEAANPLENPEGVYVQRRATASFLDESVNRPARFRGASVLVEECAKNEPHILPFNFFLPRWLVAPGNPGLQKFAFQLISTYPTLLDRSYILSGSLTTKDRNLQERLLSRYLTGVEREPGIFNPTLYEIRAYLKVLLPGSKYESTIAARKSLAALLQRAIISGQSQRARTSLLYLIAMERLNLQNLRGHHSDLFAATDRVISGTTIDAVQRWANARWETRFRQAGQVAGRLLTGEEEKSIRQATHVGRDYYSIWDWNARPHAPYEIPPEELEPVRAERLRILTQSFPQPGLATSLLELKLFEQNEDFVLEPSPDFFRGYF